MPADNKMMGDHSFHAVGHKYVNAVVKAARALPLIIPSLGEASDVASLIELADGILLPGAVSNVHPSYFGQEVRDSSLPLDPERDGLTLRLIKAAIEAEVPLLGICRGFQEINVAFGGSLHQAVHENAEMADHREVPDRPLDVQYGQVHKVSVVPGGRLAAITGVDEFMVNSLHGQGVDRLGVGLVAEAYAPDGLVEAISVAEARSFALAVQWHPEWRVLETPSYLAIFDAFGNACRERAGRRQ